ncbi:MAG: hypothetical protein JJ895_09430 [Balneolaceae bacterium]|nr:hypothetical protein [Balneolaceae bacterium]
MHFIKQLFKPSSKYNGVRLIQVYVLKLFFGLMFFLAGKDAWTELITYPGPWDNEIGIAWCAMAAYTALSGLGMIHTLRMLPIMLFMFLYKGLWLGFVAFPMWKAGTLAGSDTAEWAAIFMIMIIPFAFTPWNYVFKTYILGKN